MANTKPKRNSPIQKPSNINEYRKNRKFEMIFKGFVYTGIETTEKEARKDPHNWILNLVIRNMAGFNINPIKSISRWAK